MAGLVAPSVWADITTAAKAAKKPAHAAVAYFGSAGDRLLPLRPASVLVVDATVPIVAAGSTDPWALRRLHAKGVEIYSAASLHAKVCAFDKIAFVGSANASANSEKYLVEATFGLTDPAAIASVRSFVSSIALTKLSTADLVELTKLYNPPPPKPKAPVVVAGGRTLVMQLTMEQGLGRETQVQPPLPVWQNFFGLDHGMPLPEFTLHNLGAPGAAPQTLGVVKHHHNYTIEISAAVAPRPAILEIREVGPQTYAYRVHRPGQPRFADLQKLLNTVKNPLWTAGRKWLMI